MIHAVIKAVAKSVDRITAILGLHTDLVLPVDARKKDGSKMLALTLLAAQTDGDYGDSNNDDLFYSLST